jgi:hypothetical protein
MRCPLDLQKHRYLQPVRVCVNPGKHAHLQHFGKPHDFNHQIGADIAGPDDRHLGFFRHQIFSP